MIRFAVIIYTWILFLGPCSAVIIESLLLNVVHSPFVYHVSLASILLVDILLKQIDIFKNSSEYITGHVHHSTSSQCFHWGLSRSVLNKCYFSKHIALFVTLDDVLLLSLVCDQNTIDNNVKFRSYITLIYNDLTLLILGL